MFSFAGSDFNDAYLLFESRELCDEWLSAEWKLSEFQEIVLMLILLILMSIFPIMNMWEIKWIPVQILNQNLQKKWETIEYESTP